MNSQARIPWLRIATESVAIVASILLAFAIDAWWADVSQRQDEVASLELIQRDLEQARAHLREYAEFAGLASQSALNAYIALSAAEPYDRNYIRSELFRVDRKTVRVPRAAYTELLSTGNLRVIGDRESRDAIVRFYETVERTELIIQRNNEAFLDGLLFDIYYGEGMLLPYFPQDTGLDVVNSATRSMNERLPAGFMHRDDPLWQFDGDSPEWNRLRSALLYAAQVHSIGGIQAERMIEEADRLSRRLDEILPRSD